MILLFLALMSLSGCASTTKDLAREAAPEAVEASLASAAEPGNRQRMHDMAYEMSEAAIDGALFRLNQPENQKLVDDLTRKITAAMMREISAPISRALQKERDAAAAQAATVAVRAAMEELRKSLPVLIRDVAASPQVREAVAPLSRSAAKGAVKGAEDSLTGNAPSGEHNKE